MPPPFSSCHPLCRRRDSCPAPCCHAVPCLCRLAMPPLAVVVPVVPPAAVPPLAVVVPPCRPSLCCPMPSSYHPSSTRPSSSCGLLCRRRADHSTPCRRHPPSHAACRATPCRRRLHLPPLAVIAPPFVVPPTVVPPLAIVVPPCRPLLSLCRPSSCRPSTCRPCPPCRCLAMPPSRHAAS
jgi:hypothetical protein